MKKSSFLWMVITAAILSMSFTIATTKSVETSFWVNRDCEMCKAKIEQAADLKGVKSIAYDMDSYMLTVVYNPSKISIEQIHQSVADAGYDTSLIKASESAYNALPGCCQYDRNISPKK